MVILLIICYFQFSVVLFLLTHVGDGTEQQRDLEQNLVAHGVLDPLYHLAQVVLDLRVLLCPLLAASAS